MPGARGPERRLDGVELFAGMPTASSAIMQLGAKGRPASSVERLPSGATLYRTINTDDDVAQIIIEELDRRRVDLRANVTAVAAKNSSALQHIAVISESDTVYGRSLPLTLLAQIYGGAAQHRLADFMRGKHGGLGTAEPPEWFHTYSYLRGLDGRLPAEGAPAKSTPPPGPENSPVPREGTEGENQADYLRRLAGQLAAKHQELIRSGGNGITAIGVLGSDVYDKLMILRAIRPALPGAVFFTNNLDARLALPEEWRATHNLIVVSPFGLSLRGSYQRNIPPFRDSYQTSVFATTLMITKVLPTPQSPRDLWPPRVFEISRDGAWDLSVTPRVFFDPPRLDVLPWLGNFERVVFVAIACFSFGALLLWIALTSSWIRRPQEVDAPRRVRDEIGQILAITPVAAAVALAAGVICVWPLYFLQRFGGEPLAFTKGISIWPTEIVRVVIVVLCAHFVWKSTLALRRSNRDIRRDHRLGEEKPERKSHGRRTLLQKIVAFYQLLGTYFRAEIRLARARIRKNAAIWRSQAQISTKAGPAAPIPDEAKRVDAQKLWRDYLKRGRWSRRLRRVGPLVFLYLIGGVALFFLLGFPAVPARGLTSFIVDRVLLIICIISTIMLLFYVVDAIRLNRDLIKLFNQGISLWPEPARVRSKRNCLLNEEELAEYLDIRLIAARTEVVCPLVNYPFLILVLMIVARNSYFDNWDWPWSLIFILALNLGWAIYISLQLFRAARKARSTAVDRLSEHRLSALHCVSTVTTPEERRVAKAKLKMIEETIAEIRELNRGAFAPLSDQPFLRAILFASGSIGLGSLVQFLPNLF